MGRLAKLWFRLSKEQAGLSLVEALVAAGIIATIGVVFMGAMFTGYRSVGILDEQIQAEILARSQLEDIKDATYSDIGTYPVTVDVPPQYSVNITVGYPSCIGTADSCNVLVTDTLQEITVSVYHGDKSVLAVACYKAKQ
ncbi:hypothetical protein ACFLTB_06735 [Chloroflexota bacterium]